MARNLEQRYESHSTMTVVERPELQTVGRTESTESMEEEDESRRRQAPISVVIPAYNEEGAVRLQVEAIRTALDEQGIPHERLFAEVYF